MNRYVLSFFALLFSISILSAQTDTIPPALQCKSSLIVPVPIPCFTTVWTSDFVVSVTDNEPGPIQTGIRKRCTGSGFPEGDTTLVFLSYEWGATQVEAWARDAAGNTSSCTVAVEVTDQSGGCDPAFSIYAFLPDGQGINSVWTEVKGGNCLGDSILNQYITPVNGMYLQFGSISRPGYHTQMKPSKDINPLNGVTTYDLALIQKHILGIKPFDSPYTIIAADANQDGQVTTADIVELRKLILGITQALPNGKSWRFVPTDYVFPDPADPFQPPFPEMIVIPNMADPVPNTFHFTGVKLGDVNNSADPSQ
ncbi:MAG: hypothetical protein H6575_17785 [Lewinellaceae bacterium]|nr:hypothetical protein [Lewinellaceae bacterium]